MKIKIKFLMIFILFFNLFSFALLGQTFSLLDAIRSQFNEQEQKQLDQAQNIIKEGDKYKDKGQNFLNMAEQQKTEANKIRRKKKRKKALLQAKQTEITAYSYLIRGSKKYAQANETIFNLYHKNLSILADNISEPEKSQLLELLQKASSSFDLAKQQRQKANKQSDNKVKYSYHEQAEQYEKQAIALLMEAYTLYFRKIEQQQKQQYTDTITKEPMAENNIPQPFEKKDTIIFRIQIAASKVPLSEDKLKEIYPGFSFAFVDKDGAWYKYLIGEFNSYEQAYDFKKKINVKGAFIVAYKNGKRVKDIRTVCNPKDHPALHFNN